MVASPFSSLPLLLPQKSVKWSESRSVVSNSLWTHGQNTEVGSLFLLQRIFPTQGSNPAGSLPAKLLVREAQRAMSKATFLPQGFLNSELIFSSAFPHPWVGDFLRTWQLLPSQAARSLALSIAPDRPFLPADLNLGEPLLLPLPSQRICQTTQEFKMQISGL